MSEYKVITDACADLTTEMVQELDVHVVPMEFNLDGTPYEYYPGQTAIDVHEVYEIIRAGKPCTTSQVSPTTFEAVFETYLKEGLDVLYIGFSSGLSGTFNSGVVAANLLKEKYPDRKIICVDSLAASLGFGLLVWHSVQQKKKGATIEEVAKFVEDTRNHQAHWFTVFDLDHLKRGGRVSAAAALIGGLVGIKPVLHVDDAGHLIPQEKVRGRKASLDALVKHMEETAIKPVGEQTVFIGHADAKEDAEYVAQQIRDKFGCEDIRLGYIGPVIGSHSGPSTIALFFLATAKK